MRAAVPGEAFVLDTLNHLSLQFLYLIGWGSTLACFLICYYASKRLSWRLSAVMALLGSAWVLMLLAYSPHGTTPQEVLTTAKPANSLAAVDRAGDVASFLLVYVGALLSREGTPGKWMNAQHLQAPAMWLLFYLVMPPGLFSALVGATPPDPRYLQAYDLFFALVLGGVGFLSLTLGVYAVASRMVFSTVAVIALIYFAGIAYRYAELAINSNRPSLTTAMVLLFAIAKLALTGIVALVVLRHQAERTPLGVRHPETVSLPSIPHVKEGNDNSKGYTAADDSEARARG